MKKRQKASLLAGAIFFLTLLTLSADEICRRVEEELRRRNLYFGNIDGRSSDDFVAAVKRYQARKDLEPTGEIDQETADSLNISVVIAAKKSEDAWPDVPILKSDVARMVPAPETGGLQENKEAAKAELVEPSPMESPPPPPAESAELEPRISETEATELVEEYLHEAEANEVSPQIRFYTFPLEYFDQGRVSREFVRQDTRNYVKRWPKRKYKIVGPVTVTPSVREDEARVQFSISFTVKNRKHTVTGRTKNFWTVRRKNADELKIISIREMRLHE